MSGSIRIRFKWTTSVLEAMHIGYGFFFFTFSVKCAISISEFAIASLIAGGNLDSHNCKTLTFTVFSLLCP